MKNTGITLDRIKAFGWDVKYDTETQWGSKDDRGGENPIDPEYYKDEEEAKPAEL